jgi:mRNA-degrading endonuclease YafQ of YafQ-DinJ toxin-antitoxin module
VSTLAGSAEVMLGVIDRKYLTRIHVELTTHKLGGKLTDSRACSCGYDCRIVFSIEKVENVDTDLEVLVLLDIGTHDRVYYTLDISIDSHQIARSVWMDYQSNSIPNSRNLAAIIVAFCSAASARSLSS